MYMMVYWETLEDLSHSSCNEFSRDFHKLQEDARGVIHFSPFKKPAHFKDEVFSLNSFFIFSSALRCRALFSPARQPLPNGAHAYRARVACQGIFLVGKRSWRPRQS